MTTATTDASHSLEHHLPQNDYTNNNNNKKIEPKFGTDAQMMNTTNPITSSTTTPTATIISTTNNTNTSATSNTATSSSKITTWMEQWNYSRNRLGMLVNHSNVQFIIVLFIAINSLMLGLATCPFVKNDPQVTFIFDTTDQIFLIIFTVELICQFIYLGFYLLRDPWLVFDLLLIVSSWVFQDLTIIRSFRIFRTLRLITRIKVMRNLVLALFSVVPRMIAIFLLLTLVSYIFAVMMTQLFKDLYSFDAATAVEDTGGTDDTTVTHINYFGRIDASLFTLFQLMTLDGWADVANDVMTEYTWGWIPIIIYIIIAGFVVVNLVIAVICDAVSALKDDDKAKLHGTYHDTAALVRDRRPKKYRRKSSIVSGASTGTTAAAAAAITTTTTKPTKPAAAMMNGGGNNLQRQQHRRTIDNVAEHHLPPPPPTPTPRVAQQQSTNPPSLTSDAAAAMTYSSSISAPPQSTPPIFFDASLTELEEQVQELLQLQDSTIQRVLSITQQYQKTRMELVSSSVTTTATTKTTSK